jgi:hypothetical protein
MLALLVCASCARAASPPSATPLAATGSLTHPATTSDATGPEHDFDFELGTWHSHLRRLLHPLTGSTTWAEYDGTSVVRPVWDGRANLVELDVSGPAGHMVALSLRLFDPKTRTWSLNYANAAGGAISGPPTVGGFQNGRGEFYDHEDFGGRTILVRFIISKVNANLIHFEQSFSADEGKTWELNWITDDNRIAPTL